MSSRYARIVFVLCFVSLVISARAAEPSESERRANAAALTLMRATGFLQIPVNRQAVAETELDESLKRQVDTVFLRMESDLRPLIAAVQNDPGSLESLVTQGRKIVAAAQEEVQKLIPTDQYARLARRTRLVQTQLMAITAGPHTFDEARAALQLTPDQQTKIDALLRETSGQVRKLTNSLTNEERMTASAEQLVTVALDARKRLRAVLTEDQLKGLDDSTNTTGLDPPSGSGKRR